MVAPHELAALGLAVLFHDPPWKPWGIRGERVRGGEGEVWDRILDAIESRSGDEVARRIHASAREAVETVRARRPEARSHEVQGALLAGALRGALEAMGLDGHVRILAQAIEILAGAHKWKVVERADHLASAMDRLLLYHIEREMKEKGLLKGRKLEDMGVKLVNPFNPRFKLDASVVPQTIEAGKIVEFILEYSRLVASLARHAPGDPMYLLHAAFALLEPTWYRVVGAGYVPPADTRLPTHTVFDHLNAALATLLWSLEDELSGCLVVVDLAGVQAWIAESRRLRDLWAASWLASYLAWASVRGFVERYGPGVLVQPPARLHPFYASQIILSRISDERLRSDAAALLGLPEGWPVDPTVPSRVTLALPREACNYVEQAVLKAYWEAWSVVIERAVDTAGRLCRGLDPRVCPLADPHVAELAKRLEPPLGLRVYTARVDEAVERAGKLWRQVAEKLEEAGREALEEAVKQGREAEARLIGEAITLASEALKAEDSSTSILYPMLGRIIWEREGSTVLSAAGRRSGPHYQELARRLHELWGGKARSCLVCGKGYAVIDASAVRARGIPHRLLHELAGERLCPYCLAKRLLRYLLLNESGFAERLVGVPLTSEARKRLRWDTVNYYTARVRADFNAVRSTVEKAARGLLEIAQTVRGDIEEFVEDVYVEARGFLAPNTILEAGGEDVRREVVKAVTAQRPGVSEDVAKALVEMSEWIVGEMLHDEAFPGRLREALSNVFISHGIDPNKAEEYVDQLNSLLEGLRRSHRRRFGILKMDGDNMGKGVLAGRLDMKPSEYFKEASNLNNSLAQRALMLAAAAISRALDALWREEGGREELGPISVVVSPSYHFTVSRTLAALAQADREAVSGVDGTVVYTGGDDLLAIIPAVEVNMEASKEKGTGKTSLIIPGLALASRVRALYWGVTGGDNPLPEGFLTIKCNDYDCYVIPALRAYGKSGALLYWDAKRPLWLALKAASDLEESKDETRLEANSCNVGGGSKDIIVIASDAAGAAALPLRWGASLSELTDSLQKLVGHVHGSEKPKVARGVVSDALEYVELLSKARGKVEARALLVNLLARNIRDPNARDEAAKLLERLAPKGSGAECLALARMEVGGAAGGWISSTGLAVKSSQGIIQPLVLGLLGSLRVIRSIL